MINLQTKSRALIITLIILLIGGCRSNPLPQNKDTAGDKSVEDSVSSSALDTIAGAISPEADTSALTVLMLPSPDEILKEILVANNKYDLSIVNPLKNQKKYLDVKSQALNLGVYITDLAYINLNNDRTEALQYFKSIRELSQKLNIYQPFYGSIYDRIQKNIAVQDSLDAIFREIYYNMLDVLEASNQNDIYAFVVTGALVESLYIPAVNSANIDYKSVAPKIFEQKYIINNLYDHLLRYKKEMYIKDVLAILGDVKNILNKAETKSTKKTVLEKEKGNFTINGGEEIVVTEEMFKMMSSRVKQIREDIVNPK
jgi:hypothetical protein